MIANGHDDGRWRRPVAPHRPAAADSVPTLVADARRHRTWLCRDRTGGRPRSGDWRAGRGVGVLAGDLEEGFANPLLGRAGRARQGRSAGKPVAGSARSWRTRAVRASWLRSPAPSGHEPTLTPKRSSRTCL